MSCACWRHDENEDSTKDIDFSASGIRRRWEAGYDSTRRVIEQEPWQDECDQLDGVILHEPRDDASVAVVAPAKFFVDLGQANRVQRSLGLLGGSEMRECEPMPTGTSTGSSLLIGRSLGVAKHQEGQTGEDEIDAEQETQNPKGGGR